MGTKRMWDSPIYTHFKKHICNVCGGLLDMVQVSRVVNSKSPEAKDFDFNSGDGNLFGNVKFIWDVFLCPKCNIQTSIQEQQKIEMKQKRLEKEKKRLSKQKSQGST